MSSTQLFVLGALLIAVSALSFLGARPAAALGSGPYALMQHSNTSANAGVFRLDTSSGAVSYCYVQRTNELFCTNEVK